MNNPTIYFIASILIIIYSYKAIRLLQRAKDNTLINDERFIWIRRIITLFLVYFSLVLLVLIINFIAFNSSNNTSYFYFIRFYYYPFFIGIAILTYWIGLEGFSRRNEKEETKKYQFLKKSMIS